MISHRLHGRLDTVVRAVVEPRSRLAHVAQARDAENHAVFVLLGDFEPPLVLLVRIRLDEAELLEGRAANARAAVTRRAAALDKLGQTSSFLVRKCGFVAVQVLVET